MKTRKQLRIDGIPYEWETNLTDEGIREFYTKFQDEIAEPAKQVDGSKKIIVIPLRFDFLPFLDGICLWSASGEKHSVLYRSHKDLELWNARLDEIDELRQEQAEEEAIEMKLVLTEDNFHKEQTEAALKSGNYDAAAACVAARAKLRMQFTHLRQMGFKWNWLPSLIFARFPSSRYGIEFLKKFSPTAFGFTFFAHWFPDRCGLPDDAKCEETRAIYEEGIRLFPDCGGLAKAACLVFRRMNRYDLAIPICLGAITKGLADGTKSGFVGRLRRLEIERDYYNSKTRASV